ncbi:MAG: phytanoyl-CoA dioxygenase family protein [Alphaproteobacteria bacterium]
MILPFPEADNAVLRQAVYAGGIFRLAASDMTRSLAAHVLALLAEKFEAEINKAHERYTFADMQPAMGEIRAQLATQPQYKEVQTQILAATGFTPAELAIDALRLRCVMNNGHLNKGADLAYAAHRDTWFGNPQAQVNFWMALHDVTPAQSFMFYPSLFNRSVPNNSQGFSYDSWMDKRGWQGMKSNAPAEYPAATQIEDPAAFSFSANAGDIIIFSAAQLHQTVKNVSGITRYSLDFRAVHLGDHKAGLGAPNADNGSKPEALKDYFTPEKAA